MAIKITTVEHGLVVPSTLPAFSFYSFRGLIFIQAKRLVRDIADQSDSFENLSLFNVGNDYSKMEQLESVKDISPNISLDDSA